MLVYFIEGTGCFTESCAEVWPAICLRTQLTADPWLQLGIHRSLTAGVGAAQSRCYRWHAARTLMWQAVQLPSLDRAHSMPTPSSLTCILLFGMHSCQLLCLGSTFLEPDGSFILVTPASGLCATTMA